MTVPVTKSAATAGRGWLPVLMLLTAAVVVVALRCSTRSREPADEAAVIMVQEATRTTMRPMEVAPPQQLRWRDIAGAAYSKKFRAEFDYFDTQVHRVEVSCQPEASTLTGVITAHGLKPWFAYQLKLVGITGVLGPAEADNADDVAAWSSWQLGRLGRWWCDDCHWNVSDADLAQHLADGHTVRGYLLFDWFVTDAAGDAVHQFALDSSLHVLWRVGQRDRSPQDSTPRWYAIERGDYAYPPDLVDVTAQVGLFAEWEPDRPPIGEVKLPPGEYRVALNLTEESFHDNMDDERALEGGGFWAWVLQAELGFEVRGPVSRASCPACLPGPHEGTSALWRRG